jgi:hypothetical protein
MKAVIRALDPILWVISDTVDRNSQRFPGVTVLKRLRRAMGITGQRVGCRLRVHYS